MNLKVGIIWQCNLFLFRNDDVSTIKPSLTLAWSWWKAWDHYEPRLNLLICKGEKFQVRIYMNILSSSCSEREVTLSSLTSADCLRFFPRSTHIQARLCYQLSNYTPCGFSSAWKCWCELLILSSIEGGVVPLLSLNFLNNNSRLRPYALTFALAGQPLALCEAFPSDAVSQVNKQALPRDHTVHKMINKTLEGWRTSCGTDHS